jgi:DNA invertase Pin-like site-specific DNA recombinase
MDESLTYQDCGVSALRGRHAKTGKLSLFLAAIEEGKVHPGDILIVEALDRLTRQKPLEAVGLVSRILEARIRIVTLDPEREYDWDSANDQFVLFEMVNILCTGNRESERKRTLASANWDEALRRAKQGTPISSHGPAWLRLVDKVIIDNHLRGGRWEKIPDKVAIVKRMVRIALDGHGIYTIMRMLNAEGIHTLARDKTWDVASVRSILRSPTLIGNWQPMTERAGKRKTACEIIEGYYPAIITKQQYYRLQETLDSRTQGRTGRGVATLFKGLMRNLAGHAMIVSGKHGYATLVSQAAKKGVPGSKYVTFRYDVWEKYFLRFVKQLKPEDLRPAELNSNATETEVERIEGELRDKDSRITTIQKRIDSDPQYETLLDTLHRLKQQRLKLADSLESLRKSQHQESAAQTLKETKSIVELLAEAGDDRTEIRTRLRAQIRRLVECIQFEPFVATMDGVTWRCCIAVIRFRSGAERRIIIARNRKGEEQYETFASEDGIHAFTEDTLAVRLGILPRHIKATATRRTP